MEHGDGKYTVYSEFALSKAGLIVSGGSELLSAIEVALMVSPTARALVVAGIPSDSPKDWEA